jgi:hypothetical protein
MKGITRYEGERIGLGWEARTRWRGVTRRRRFADSTWGGQQLALSEAGRWLISANRALGKPLTDRWIRSHGGWGRAGKRGKWTRRQP